MQPLIEINVTKIVNYKLRMRIVARHLIVPLRVSRRRLHLLLGAFLEAT